MMCRHLISHDINVSVTAVKRFSSWPCRRETVSVQSNLAKGRIADLSPHAAANGFVRSGPHLDLLRCSLDHGLDRFIPFRLICTAHPCAERIQTHRPRYVRLCSNGSHRPMHCMHAVQPTKRSLCYDSKQQTDCMNNVKYWWISLLPCSSLPGNILRHACLLYRSPGVCAYGSDVNDARNTATGRRTSQIRWRRSTGKAVMARRRHGCCSLRGRERCCNACYFFSV